MALITDPDQLNQATEVVIDTTGKTVQLLVAGNLSTDGVTLKCLYSFLKEEWKSDSNLIKFAFPMVPITDEQFELVNGWDFKDSTTRNLIRTGGWALKDAAGISLEEYAGIITLGSLGSTDQVYYTQQSGYTAPTTNVVLTGVVNQAVKIYGDAAHGNFDYRSFLQLYCRVYQKISAAANLTDIGVSTMTYQAYRFPLTNSADTKVTHADGVSSLYGVTITWYGTDQSRTIGGSSYNFKIIIDGNNRTAEEIYEAVQYNLRQSGDIDAGASTKNGKVVTQLLGFVGDTLICKIDGTNGVYIDNFQTTDTNRLTFVDNTGALLTFPFVAVLRLQFGDNLIADTDAIYRVFFTNAGGNLYGTSSAILVDDDDGVDMSGSVSGSPYVDLTFAYDTNVQGGRTAGTDADVTAIAIGLQDSQFVKTTGTIGRSVTNVISLSSSLERNYQNV